MSGSLRLVLGGGNVCAIGSPQKLKLQAHPRILVTLTMDLNMDRKLFWDMLWQRVSTSTERKYIAYKLLWWYRLIETNWSPTAVLLHWEESSDKWWPAACHVRWPWPAPSWQRWEGVTKGGSVRRLNEFNIVLKRALGIFTSFQFSLDFDQLQPKSSLDLSGNTTEQISI